MIVIETMPGVTREQIREATGFAVPFDADCRGDLAAARTDTLCSPAKPDRSARAAPPGIRRRRERGALLAEILADDRAFVDRASAQREQGRQSREDP